MKHNIRINGQVKEIDCELGSGIFDKNGKEIFEGDIIKLPTSKTTSVIFNKGAFWQEEANCILYPVNKFEIVGHVTD